ncbi:hypothetical protein [Saccharibacter floricola]|uniref:hypothetical protein n=1 Tax=Saccharibacter floricola TaxID=231053 RepID=UPI00036C681A|nr:hypothetical protein [Saccharibacter floricola]
MSEMTQMPLPSDGAHLPDWIHLLPLGTFPAVGRTKTLRTGMMAVSYLKATDAALGLTTDSLKTGGLH